MEKLENLERVAWNELKKLNSIYAGKEEFAEKDAEQFCKLSQALKNFYAAIAMKESEEYEGMGVSGRRGRSPSTGRYVSRDAGSSYDQGYSAGYADAQMSGHMPYPPMYPTRY